jgi:hypothetical protein
MLDRGEATKWLSKATNFYFFVVHFSFFRHWNDPDTLLLGNFGLSLEQSKHQLAIWAVISAPFLISNDLRKIDPEVKELLLNREIIAINQDPLGIQGKRINAGYNIEMWAR